MEEKKEDKPQMGEVNKEKDEHELRESIHEISALDKLRNIEINVEGVSSEKMPDAVAQSTILENYGKWEINPVHARMQDEPNWNKPGSYWFLFCEKHDEMMSNLAFGDLKLSDLLVMFEVIKDVIKKHVLDRHLNLIQFDADGKIAGVGTRPNDHIPPHYMRFEFETTITESQQTIDDLKEADNIWDMYIDPQNPAVLAVYFVGKPGMKAKMVEKEAACIGQLLLAGPEMTPGCDLLPKKPDDPATETYYRVKNFHSFSIRMTLETAAAIAPAVTLRFAMENENTALLTVVDPQNSVAANTRDVEKLCKCK